MSEIGKDVGRVLDAGRGAAGQAAEQADKAYVALKGFDWSELSGALWLFGALALVGVGVGWWEQHKRDKYNGELAAKLRNEFRPRR